MSAPYTVLVSLAYTSPYVGDGRSSIADMGFSVTFENFRLEYFGEKEMFMTAYRVRGNPGRGILSRCSLNRVETGGKVVTPKITKPHGEKFEAWLDIVPGPYRDSWGKPPEGFVNAVPLQFRTSWGRDMMAWDYEVGHSYLEEECLEVFWVDWAALKDGAPVSITLPYKGADEEDEGTWWIEFLPPKKEIKRPSLTGRTH